MKIVILEEDTSLREAVARALQRNGHRVLSYGSPPELIASMNATQADLAIVDVGIQGMDGVETALRLRKEGFKGPLFLATGMSNPRPLDMYLQHLQPCRVVGKPFNLKELKALVDEALKPKADAA